MKTLNLALILGLSIMTVIPSAGAVELDPSTLSAMAEENNGNWRILWAMQELAPAHNLTKAVESYVLAEYQMLLPAHAFAKCDSDTCQQEAAMRFIESIPHYSAELMIMMQYQDKVAAGEIQLSKGMQELWIQFFPEEDRSGANDTLAALNRAYQDYAIAKQTEYTEAAKEPRTRAYGAGTDASKYDASSTVTSPQTSYSRKPSNPEYRTEYVNGEEFLVGSLDGTNVWVQMICRNDGCNKLYAWVLVSNGSNGSYHFMPDTDVQLTVYDSAAKSTAVKTFSPSEWIEKQETKAAWKAFGTGLLVGLANSGPSGTYSGNVSAHDSYGGYSYGSYYGTYTDYGQKADKINRETEYYASRIAQAFQDSTGSLLYAETLSPGENVVGTVYFEKFPNKLNQAQLTVTAGGKRFEFSYGLR